MGMIEKLTTSLWTECKWKVSKMTSRFLAWELGGGEMYWEGGEGEKRFGEKALNTVHTQVSSMVLSEW